MKFFKFFVIFLAFLSCKKKEIIKDKKNSVNYEIMVSYKLSKGETLERVLLWKIPFMSVSEGYYFIKFFESKVNTRSLKDGDKFIFLFDEDKKLKEVSFIRRDTPFVINKFLKNNESLGFDYKRIRKKYDIDTALIFVRIKENLYEAFEPYEGGIYLADFIADCFSWVIDFNTEVRKDDEIIVLFEKKSVEGEFISFGNILYILYKGKYTGKKDAIYFNGAYYDSSGNSLERYFLRSPLPFGRISSRFKLKRFHPILRIVRPHFGIDYVAPAGTPVFAVADGEIVYAGWKGGYGIYVEIKHRNNYRTGYGHLKRLAPYVIRGKKVKQREIIGYVGSTGLSTGPHLHFEVKKDGKFINFLDLKPSPKVVLGQKEKKNLSDLLLKIKKKIYEKKYIFPS
ncbi:MAG: peptidoglycan DD-metalloendopeptidase family protein [Candidatus Hydrothermales bacterium]